MPTVAPKAARLVWFKNTCSVAERIVSCSIAKSMWRAAAEKWSAYISTSIDKIPACCMTIGIPSAEAAVSSNQAYVEKPFIKTTSGAWATIKYRNLVISSEKYSLGMMRERER